MRDCGPIIGSARLATGAGRPASEVEPVPAAAAAASGRESLRSQPPKPAAKKPLLQFEEVPQAR